jgi:hypothetical protein
MYSLLYSTKNCGRKASHCRGYKPTDKAARIGCVTPKRTSATINSTDKALKNNSLEMADGPCLKKAGGDLSSVPSGMGCRVQLEVMIGQLIRW